MSLLLDFVAQIKKKKQPKNPPPGLHALFLIKSYKRCSWRPPPDLKCYFPQDNEPFLVFLLQSHTSCCSDALCPTQNHKGDSLGPSGTSVYHVAYQLITMLWLPCRLIMLDLEKDCCIYEQWLWNGLCWRKKLWPTYLGKRLLHVLRATRRLPETFNSA